MSLPLSCCARNVGNQNVRRSDEQWFFPMQGRVIILGFNSSIHSIYVILVSALSANVTLNHLILMEKQRARGPRNGGKYMRERVCVFVDEQQGGVGQRGLTV